MQRRIAALLVVLAFGIGLAGCAKDKKSAAKPSGTTSTSIPASTSVAAAPATSTTIPAGPPATPEGAANGLFNAWKNHDEPGASNYAKPDAIKKMFAQAYNDPSVAYTNHGCQPQGGQYNCAWSYEGGALIMTVEAWPGGGFVVASIKYIAD